MISAPSSTALVAAGIVGTLFLGYCFYFDSKRRADPLYKQKIRERRLKNMKSKKKSCIVAPDFSDVEAVQKFFFQEMQLGEELLTQGEIESGLEHLSAAISVCGQPRQLLHVLQQSLPAPVFTQLLQKLPNVFQRLTGNMEEEVE